MLNLKFAGISDPTANTEQTAVQGEESEESPIRVSPLPSLTPVRGWIGPILAS